MRRHFLPRHSHDISGVGAIRSRQRVVRAFAATWSLTALILSGATALAQQTTSPPLKVDTRPPSVAVLTSFEPGERTEQLRLRVAVGPTSPGSPPVPVGTPKVEERNTARGVGRPINMSFDAATGTFVGTIDGFESTLVGFVKIEVADVTGKPEYHFTSFAVSAPTRKPVTPVHTTDGQLTIFLTPSSLPESARIIASTQERPWIPLPSGVVLVNGPFDIVALRQPNVLVKTIVNVRLPAEQPVTARTKTNYTIRRLDPVTRTWTRLPSLADGHGFVQAASDHLGTFVLTSE